MTPLAWRPPRCWCVGSGIRCALMQTPPRDRSPVLTFVEPWDQGLIEEGISRELDRGGQVFFVHNRVRDIGEVKEMLMKIVPNIDIGVAHGQMDGDHLEGVLLKFINREYDVLLCTNIIESGIDIANANTIIINNAHQFGLSDTHQLRGRVGRSNKHAFCYLLAPPLSTLSNESRQRLKTIEEFSDLGSGFNIANIAHTVVHEEHLPSAIDFILNRFFNQVGVHG